MFYVIGLSLLACSQDTQDTSLPDPPPEQDAELCTTDEFCDAFMECYAFMGLETCESYYADGMGVCADADADVLEEYHACMCDCWTSGEDRTCFGMGSCSDWCSSTICSLF